MGKYSFQMTNILINCAKNKKSRLNESTFISNWDLFISL